MKPLFILAIALACLSCSEKRQAAYIWRGVIEMQGQELPFNFDLQKKTDSYTVTIHNADERLVLDEVRTEDDSLVIVMHIFDSELRVKQDDDTLKGYFVKNYEKNFKLPFTAIRGQTFRFANADKDSIVDYSGRWATWFTNDTDTTQAVGIFKQDGSHVTGTFLTTTGDYRYLQGNVVNGQLHLSAFDGNHAFLFNAYKNGDNKLSGEFLSGRSWYQFWDGEKNDSTKLPDPETLTYLKEGYTTVDFSFPGLDGKKISPRDEAFKGKVLIIQLFGTWCPNCMDETKFLTEWYRQNKNRGVEIIALSYEAKDDFEYAVNRIQKMKEKIGPEYTFLIAGNRDKAMASATLPMLSRVLAFPTTIFIGKDGNVKKIETGFTGPGTLFYYDQFVQRFNETVNELLAEENTLP
jgi:thiol-disulfide isomerase/thioredoxin